MTQITPDQALDVRGWLIQAAEAALISNHVPEAQRAFYGAKFSRCFENAVRELGYRLVPLTQDKNDSGRLSEVPEPEPAQMENCNG